VNTRCLGRLGLYNIVICAAVASSPNWIRIGQNIPHVYYIYIYINLREWYTINLPVGIYLSGRARELV